MKRSLLAHLSRRRLLGLAGALLVAPSVACSFPEKGQLRVVSQASPNPLVGVKKYAVARVTWEGFTYEGRPEAAWQATRSPEQRASFANDKVVITEKILKTLQTNQDDGESFVAASGAPAHTLHYNVSAYDDGKFHWSLEILDPQGVVVDVIQGPPTGYGWGFAQQYGFLVVVASTHTQEYLRARTRAAP
jgi:hypothetical protein